jgi:PAS domain S-box-containing protein
VNTQYVLIPAATFVVTASLLGYVLAQRTRSSLFGGLVAVLCSILAWIGGMLIGTVAEPQSLWASFGVVLHFAGVCSVASAFVLLALSFAHASLIEEQPRAVRIAMTIPGVLCFAIVITNPLHGLFGAALDGSFFAQDDASWRGPLYPLVVAWVYVATISGLAVCVHRGIVTHDREERRRLFLVALGAASPLVGYLVQNAGWVAIPPQVPAATLCLTSSALIVVVGIASFGFLDSVLLPLRSVIDQIADGLLLVDIDGRVTETNPVALQLVGVERATLVGATLADVLESIGDDGQAYASLWLPARRDAQTERIEAQGRTIDVTFGWLHDRNGERIGGFVVLADRTEQQNHQRLRHRTQRLESMSVLLAGIAHEINNPLAYLRANLGHLTSMATDLEKSMRYVPIEVRELFEELAEVIDDSAQGVDHIAGVVERTRRLVPRDSEPVAEEVDVSLLLEQCVELAARYTHSKAALECVLPPSLPKIRGNGGRLQQVFLNLLVNAHQSLGPDGGQLRVSARILDEASGPAESGNWIEVQVEDDGPGVPAAIQDQIFDPFFTTKDPDKGMGLGLSIVHDIVREHGGELTLGESELGGAAFVVRLKG